MSRNSLLEAGTKSEIEVTATVFVYELSGSESESSCSHCLRKCFIYSFTLIYLHSKYIVSVCAVWLEKQVYALDKSIYSG